MTTGVNFLLDVEPESNRVIVSWDKKSPKVESEMMALGGSFEDFNAYRFRFDMETVKKINSYAKPRGGMKVTQRAKDSLSLLKASVVRARSLSGGSADADVSELLWEEAPDTAKALRPYQRAGVQFMLDSPSTLLADEPGAGKAQPLSEPVLTPEGWRTMGDIREGSQVVGADGRPINVLKVFPQGKREVVKVTFSDGVVVRCDWDHLWHTQNKREKEITGKHKVMTTREIFNAGVLTSSGRSRFSVPMSAPVEFSEKNFPIDPYTWGVLTGDGSLSQSNSSITTDHEIAERLILPEGASAKLVHDKGWWGEYRLNGLGRFLREHGLNGTRSEEKVVPVEIMTGSIEQRVSYLQGLLDTDGGTGTGRDGKLSSSIEYGTVSERLAYQVADLVQSLGGNATVRTKQPYYTYRGGKRAGQLFYQMNIRLPEGIKPFRLKRKADKWIPRAKYQPQRWIRSIESTGKEEEMQCILVDSDDHLYLTTGYVVTHNTLSSIATMISAGVTGDILVLAPAAAIQVTWPAEVARWSPNDEIITVTGPRAKREAALARLRFLPKEGKRRWVLCNIEMAKVKYHKPFELDGKAYKGRYEYAYPELFFLDYSGKMKNARKWEAIIVDESHRALITKKTRSHEQTQTRCGLGKLATVEGGRRIAISGTPFRGKLENLWGTLNWLFPETYTAYWHWVNEWFSTESNFFGGSKITSLDGSEAEFYRSIEPFTLRRTKREISPDLPPKTYAGFVPEGMEIEEEGQERGLVGHWLEMKPKQQRAYYQMVEQALATLENGTLVANGVLAEMTRLKQFASCFGKLERKMDSDGYEVDVFKPELPSNKLDWLLEFFTELGIDKDGQEGPDARKVVVASQFTSMINLFEREINKRGIKTLKVVGGVSAEDRIAAVNQFQTDSGPQVFLLNTLAGGVSLTLDRADDIVILDETFIPDDQEQVEDRVHRVSRMHNVTVHYVRSLGTIEEKIARLTFGRNINTKQILDGERGVEFARQILGN